MNKFTSAYSGKALKEAEGDQKANVTVLRDVCHAVALCYETLQKGDIRLLSINVQDCKDESHYDIIINHYLYGSLNRKRYSFEKKPEQDCIKAFTDVFGEISTLETNKVKNESDGATINVAHLTIKGGFIQDADHNLYILYRDIKKGQKWEEYGIEDPETFKNEVDFLYDVTRKYLG